MPGASRKIGLSDPTHLGRVNPIPRRGQGPYPPVYCPFASAALNMKEETDWLFGPPWLLALSLAAGGLRAKIRSQSSTAKG